jgi:hypothetical protein
MRYINYENFSNPVTDIVYARDRPSILEVLMLLYSSMDKYEEHC